MLKHLLYLFLLLLGTSSFSQTLQFCTQKNGKPKIDIQYQGSDAYPKMRDMSYYTCCWTDPLEYNPKLQASISCWVKNTGNSTVNETFLEVEFASNTPYFSYSDTVNLMSGDSVKLEIPTFRDLTHTSLKVYGNTILQVEDSLLLEEFGIDSGVMSSYFNKKADGFISDKQFSQVVLLMPFDKNIDIQSMELFIGNSGSTYGDVLVEFYDSAAFNPTSGFIGSPKFSNNEMINQAGWNTVEFWPIVRLGNSNNIEYAWVNISFFVDFTQDTLNIGFTKKISPGSNALWYKRTQDSVYNRAAEAPFEFGNPMLKLNTFIHHWDPMSGIGISEAEINHLNIYPNPVIASLQITLDPAWLEASISISDLSGKKVFSKKVRSEEKINISFLQPGIYIVMATHEGKTTTKRLVKM